MLQLSDALKNQPVLSLRTGGSVATTSRPIINPNNLKIEGIYCQDFYEKKQVVLVEQDIRDILPQGFVVNDADVLTEPGELIRLKEIMQFNFDLIGKQVVTEDKKRLGKVSDFAFDTSSLYIKKLYISQSLFKDFTGGNFGIDRTQIVEITPKKIVVQDLLQNVPSGAGAMA